MKMMVTELIIRNQHGSYSRRVKLNDNGTDDGKHVGRDSVQECTARHCHGKWVPPPPMRDSSHRDDNAP